MVPWFSFDHAMWLAESTLLDQALNLGPESYARPQGTPKMCADGNFSLSKMLGVPEGAERKQVP